MNSNSFSYSTAHQADDESSALYLLGFARVRSTQPMRVVTDSRKVLTHLQLPESAAEYPQLLQPLGIECVQVGSVVAWFKRIDRSEFTGDAGAANLSNLDWLTPRVLAHEAVVSQLNVCFPFYPARFGCLFSSAAKLVEFTDRHYATLQGFFQHVEGRNEWGIKFIASVDQATSQMADEVLQADGQTSAGVNYLRLKQLQRKLRPVALQTLEHHCGVAIAELQAMFRFVVVRPRTSMISPDRESVISNVSLLLSEAEAQQLSEWQTAWNERSDNRLGLEARVAGAWPAYSFCPPLSDEEPRQQVA